MALEEWDGYVVGEQGWFEVLDPSGEDWHWVHGEIIRLYADPEEAVWALLRTLEGPRLCRLSGYAGHDEEEAHAPRFAPAPERRQRRG